MRLVKYKSIANSNAASSRIRCFRFFKFMAGDYNFCDINDTNYINAEVDLLFIQKIATKDYINVAKVYASKNIPIIYDIDDDFGVWENMFEKDMLNIVSAITTDTIERKQYLEKYTKTPIYVIPDAIDYVNDKSRAIIIKDKISNIYTFGSGGNIEYSVPYLLQIPNNYNTYYITGADNTKLRSIKKILWMETTFISYMYNADICILIHPDDARGNMKSNNRLLVSMSLGIPCIVSNTSAYKETMKSIGCDILVAKSENDVKTILTQLESVELRKEISAKFYEYAWNNFSPQISSDKLSELFKTLFKK